MQEIKTKIENEDCPKCGMPMDKQTIAESKIERFDLKTRTVFGHCEKCNTSSEIEQVQKFRIWETIRYRHYELKPQGWHKVNDLPVPIVVIGNEI